MESNRSGHLAPRVLGLKGAELHPIEGSEGDAAEGLDLPRRFWIALSFTVPLALLALGDGLLADALDVEPCAFAWLELALCAPVIFYAGGPILTRGWRSLRARRVDTFVLALVGIAAALA